MKANRLHPYRRVVLAWAILGLALAAPVLAQSGGGITLTWSTLCSGGASAGGAYGLSSVAGQAEGGHTMSGGGYMLSGGFLVESVGIPVTGGYALYLPLIKR